MPSRTVSEQWEAARVHLSRVRTWLGTPERTHSLLLLLRPLVTLLIAVLVIRLVSTAKKLADLIAAVASLMWPLVIFAIVSWFRPEFRPILSRIRKGKFLGTEFELDELQAKTEALEARSSKIVSLGNSGLGAVSLGDLRRIGLDPVTARLAPHDKPDTGRSGVAQGHRRTQRRLLPPLRAECAE